MNPFDEYGNNIRENRYSRIRIIERKIQVEKDVEKIEEYEEEIKDLYADITSIPAAVEAAEQGMLYKWQSDKNSFQRFYNKIISKLNG